MAYISNTITDANSPSVMTAAIEAALTSAGYTLTDTVAISTRTHRIWRNPAANNPLNKDWYLDIAYTTSGAGTIGLYIMEDYNPTTDLAFRMAYTTTGSATLSAANSYTPYGTTGYSLENGNWFLRAASTPYNRDITLPATSFGYWVSVTNQRVVAMFSSSPDKMLYAGIYEPSADYVTTAGSDIFPIVSANLYGGMSSLDVAFTRYPKITGAITTFYQVCTSNLSSFLGVFNTPSVPSGGTGASSRFAVKIPIHSTSPSAGAFYGWFIDVAAVYADATVTRGDTLTDESSNVWVLATRHTSISVMMLRS